MIELVRTLVRNKRLVKELVLRDLKALLGVRAAPVFARHWCWERSRSSRCSPARPRTGPTTRPSSIDRVNTVLVPR